MQGSDYELGGGPEERDEGFGALLLIICSSLGATCISADLGGAIQLYTLQSQKGAVYLGTILGAVLASAGVSYALCRAVFMLSEQELLRSTFLGAALGGGLVPAPLLYAESGGLVRYGMAVGAGIGVAFSVVVLSGRAYKDAKRLRTTRQATELTEDAWTEYARGEVEKAESLLLEALGLCKSRLGVRNLVTLVTSHSLANLYRVGGQYDRAAELYNRVEVLYSELIDEPNPRGMLQHHLALNLMGQGEYREAIDREKRALKYFEQCDPDEVRHEKSMAHTEVAKSHVSLGEEEQALKHYKAALDLVLDDLGPRHPLVIELLGSLSGCYVKLSRFHESEGFLERLVEQLDEMENPNYEIIVEGLLDLGRVRVEQGKFDDAMPLYTKGLQLLQQQVGPKEALLGKVLEGFDHLASAQTGEIDGAVDLLVLFRGEREKIRTLVEARPDWVHSRDRTGWGPLQWAIFMGREDIAGWLLKKGASLDYESDRVLGPLHVAAAWNRRTAMIELLGEGVDVDSRGPRGWTPLFWACRFGHIRLVDLILKKKAQVNLRDDNGVTPLHLAAIHGHAQVVVSLLAADAKVNAKETGRRRTPMHFAVENNHLKCVEVLMINGGDVEVQDSEGNSGLSLAQSSGHRLLHRFMKRFLTGRGRWEGLSEVSE